MTEVGDRSFGVVGLGRMGGGIAAQAMGLGMRVVGYTRSGVPEDLTRAGVQAVDSERALAQALSPPRIIFVYVPAGPVIDTVMDTLCEHLEPGDILIDGGNSYWGDSRRRHARFKERGFHFLDLGTSGGVQGAEHGACFMIGGEREPVAQVEPILKALAVERGYVHAGGPGCGHFVKLVHNGIEFGMLQAIGEGMAVMDAFPEKLPTVDVLDCWAHGSVIRSWLVELMRDQLRERERLDSVPDYIEDTGEVNWLVDDALNLEVPVPVIAQSVMALFVSRERKQAWAQSIAMMRHGFGEHPFGADEGIEKERREGRIGGFPPELRRTT